MSPSNVTINFVFLSFLYTRDNYGRAKKKSTWKTPSINLDGKHSSFGRMTSSDGLKQIVSYIENWSRTINSLNHWFTNAKRTLEENSFS